MELTTDQKTSEKEVETFIQTVKNLLLTLAQKSCTSTVISQDVVVKDWHASCRFILNFRWHCHTVCCQKDSYMSARITILIFLYFFHVCGIKFKNIRTVPECCRTMCVVYIGAASFIWHIPPFRSFSFNNLMLINI